MFRSRWPSVPFWNPDSPFRSATAVAASLLVGSSSAASAFGVAPAASVMVSAVLPGDLASLKAMARSLIAGGKRTSQNAAFASVPDSASPNKAALAVLRWQAYVRALQNA